MKKSPMLVGGLVGGFSWIVGYTLTMLALSGLSSTAAYGVLAGWWCAAYVSSFMKTPVLSAVPLFLFHLTLFVMVAFTGNSWFYRDVSSLTLIGILEVGAMQAFVVCSPILFNGIFVKITGVMVGNLKRRND